MILDECLTHLSDIIKDLPIRVLVLDNASTDSTPTVCAKYPWIVYHRNDRNIGGDNNILKSYILAAESGSDYICVIGDSYRFNTGLDSLIDTLATNKYDLVVIGRNDPWTKRFSMKSYEDINLFMSEIGGSMDLTGTIVIHSRGVQEKFYKDAMWSNFIHTTMALNFISSIEHPKIKFYSDLYLSHTTINKDGTSWYRDMVKIFTKVWAITIMSLPGYSVDARLACIANHDEVSPVFKPHRFIALKQRGFLRYSDLKKYRTYLPFVTKEPFWKLTAICILPCRVSWWCYYANAYLKAAIRKVFGE